MFLSRIMTNTFYTLGLGLLSPVWCPYMYRHYCLQLSQAACLPVLSPIIVTTVSNNDLNLCRSANNYISNLPTLLLKVEKSCPHYSMRYITSMGTKLCSLTFGSWNQTGDLLGFFQTKVKAKTLSHGVLVMLVKQQQIHFISFY